MTINTQCNSSNTIDEFFLSKPGLCWNLFEFSMEEITLKKSISPTF
jgi:hypothetical protein